MKNVMVALVAPTKRYQMRYKLVDVSNMESIGNRQILNTHKFDFDGNVFYFGDIRSSRVRQITIDDDVMIVQTKNSTYRFEKEKQDV